MRVCFAQQNLGQNVRKNSRKKEKKKKNAPLKPTTHRKHLLSPNDNNDIGILQRRTRIASICENVMRHVHCAFVEFSNVASSAALAVQTERIFFAAGGKSQVPIQYLRTVFIIAPQRKIRPIIAVRGRGRRRRRRPKKLLPDKRR